MPFPADFKPIKDSEVPGVTRGALVQGVNPNELAEVSIFVRADPSNESLSDFVGKLASQRVADRQYLSRDAFAEQHSAAPEDLDAVERYASQNALTVMTASPRHRMVRVKGTLGNLAKAFNVQLAVYRSARGTFRAHEGPISVPSELSDVVEGVFGLDNKPPASTHFRIKPSVGRGVSSRVAGNTYTPVQVANLYGFPSLTGQGQRIAIIEFGGGFRMNDLKDYFENLNLPTPNVTAVSVGGALNSPTNPNSADMEVMLDIEVVAAIAPDAQIVVYFAPNSTLGWFLGVGEAIHDAFRNPSIISISWGGPEKFSWNLATCNAIDILFQAAAAMGITVCAAAGDNGYTDGVPGSTPYVDFPASSPYVLACGGTSLKSVNGTISDETVWNDGPNPSNPKSATGGGVSTFFPQIAPSSYQSNVNVPPSENTSVNPARGVPDVAGNADPNTGYIIRVDGTTQTVGGTSAVAPLWAGLLALVNQQLGKPVGFVNPLLYSQGVAGGGFNDIVDGSNGKYQAGPGWDPCTGLGSPNGAVLPSLL